MKLIKIIIAVLIAATEVAYINSSSTGRMAFGTTMTLAEYPKFNYHVKIHLIYPDGRISFGSGSLIAPNIVLTAAHVLYGKESVVVVVGKTTRTDIYDPDGITVRPDKFVIHENYTDPVKPGVINKMNYDIALLFLPNPLELTQMVNTIDLACGNFNCEDVNAKAWLSGHGGLGKTPEAINLSESEKKELRYAVMQPFPLHQCVDYYPSFSTHRTQICTEIIDGKTGGGCSGDSGGPYAFEDPNNPKGKRKLCGIASTASKDNCESYPTGYVSVPYFAKNGWICENTNRAVGCDCVVP